MDLDEGRSQIGTANNYILIHKKVFKFQTALQTNHIVKQILLTLIWLWRLTYEGKRNSGTAAPSTVFEIGDEPHSDLLKKEIRADGSTRLAVDFN